MMMRVMRPVFILKTHHPSGQTWANIWSSSGYASLVYKDGHQTHYASRRTILRSASFPEGTCYICSHSQRQSPRKRLGVALEENNSISEGKKARKQLFEVRPSEAGPSLSSQKHSMKKEIYGKLKLRKSA